MAGTIRANVNRNEHHNSETKKNVTSSASPEVDRIFDNRTNTGDDSDYATAVEELATEKYSLWRIQFSSNEAKRRRICQLARTCEFSIIDKEIKEHIILTFSSCSLRRRALRENFTLEALLKLGRALELSEKQASQVEAETAGVNATETKGSIDVVAYAGETLLTATSYNRQNPTKRTRDACGKVGHF